MSWEHDDALRGMIRRVRIQKVDDADTQQRVRISGLKSEQLDKVHRFQNGGITHNPPEDAEGFLLSLGGRSDRAVMLGGEHKDHRPKNTPIGGTVLYDAYGNIASIVAAEIRIVHSSKITLSAPVIVLDGLCKLGGEDANLPAAMQGTIDTGGFADISALSSKVLIK